MDLDLQIYKVFNNQGEEVWSEIIIMQDQDWARLV